MGMGIGGFYTQAVAKDFSRDFQMRVVSIGPGILTEKDNVYITTAVVPGYAIANQAVPFMGVQFNVPGSGNFPGSDAWSVTFRCDQGLNIREKILTWQKSIFNAFPGTAGESIGAYGPKYSETIAKLTVFEKSGKEVRGIKLIGIYPTLVGELAYDQTGNGVPVTLPVTLAYQWWEPESVGSVIP